MKRSKTRIPIVVDGVHVLPVLHESLESADRTRRAVDELQPDAIAVEIPSSLERAWLKAVDRMPAISVLLYENARDRTIYLPVQPADPLVEAARLARQRGLPLRCADLDVDGYADYRDPVPDSYALLRLGMTKVYGEFRAGRRPRDPQDSRRESCMAYHARQLRAEGARKVLLVCGMHHAEPVADGSARGTGRSPHPAGAQEPPPGPPAPGLAGRGAPRGALLRRSLRGEARRAAPRAGRVRAGERRT